MALDPISFLAAVIGVSVASAAVGSIALTTTTRLLTKKSQASPARQAAAAPKKEDAQLAAALAAEHLDPLASIPDDFNPAEAREAVAFTN